MPVRDAHEEVACPDAEQLARDQYFEIGHRPRRGPPIEVEREAGVDALGFDIDCPEEISLPAYVQIDKRYDWKLEIFKLRSVMKRPQTMLSVDHFKWRKLFGRPIWIPCFIWELETRLSR
ncbi:MAG: hypothetical protein AB7G35_15040 [Hyphomicrobiaceae bacterium]